MSNKRDDSEDEVIEQLQALGYIDPGAGNSILQIFLGALFKVSGAIKSFFRKLFGSRQEKEAGGGK